MRHLERKIFEDREKDFYASIYKNEIYNKSGNDLRLKRELSNIKELSGLKHFKRILSIGCGAGEFEMMLSGYCEHITAVDISPEAISLAKKRQDEFGISNIEFRAQSFYDLDWKESFDAIICIAFLHHIPESDFFDFLKQIYQHLNKKGFFYSQDPNVNGILRKVGRMVMGKNYDKYHTPDERELNPKELSELLYKIGFEDIKIKNIDLILIPALYMFTRGYKWLMYFCYYVDWLWCRSLFEPLGSGFSQVSWKK